MDLCRGSASAHVGDRFLDHGDDLLGKLGFSLLLDARASDLLELGKEAPGLGHDLEASHAHPELIGMAGHFRCARLLDRAESLQYLTAFQDGCQAHGIDAFFEGGHGFLRSDGWVGKDAWNQDRRSRPIFGMLSFDMDVRCGR
ncbi:hypothetical protein GCM10022600_07540 [Qipengyuania pelagi]|uniref:Uncharacterized protein n=1 Tax=Qipengyuania pelagi TaxID=994320 RepID=A0A844YBL4_9SPHN|nr:hypothetical protein [Qipengyuania pelagi]MXO54368.1 hypothetical protein [Qipengyuania pelagi]